MLSTHNRAKRRKTHGTHDIDRPPTIHLRHRRKDDATDSLTKEVEGNKAEDRKRLTDTEVCVARDGRAGVADDGGEEFEEADDESIVEFSRARPLARMRARAGIAGDDSRLLVQI